MKRKIKINLVQKRLDENQIIYKVGYLENNYFVTYESVKNNTKTLKVKLKEKKLSIFFSKVLFGIELEFEYKNKDFELYKIKDSANFLLIEYAVDSHVQIPKVILKSFTTNNQLYYIDLKDKKIKRSGAGTFNTKFGHFSKMYEDFLSLKYENVLGMLKELVENFYDGRINVIDLKKYIKTMKELFIIADFRNPDFIDRMNKKSYTSLIVGGYTTEHVTSIAMQENLINFYDNMGIFLVINKTNANFLTCKSMYYDISIDNGNKCLFMPLHPKYGIMLVPNEYYKEKTINGNKYMSIEKETFVEQSNNILIQLMLKNTNECIIGKKEDLEKIINDYDLGKKD